MTACCEWTQLIVCDRCLCLTDIPGSTRLVFFFSALSWHFSPPPPGGTVYQVWDASPAKFHHQAEGGGGQGGAETQEKVQSDAERTSLSKTCSYLSTVICEMEVDWWWIFQCQEKNNSVEQENRDWKEPMKLNWIWTDWMTESIWKWMNYGGHWSNTERKLIGLIISHG